MTKLNNHEVEITFEEFQQAIKRIEGCLINTITFNDDYASIIIFNFDDHKSLKINWDWDYFLLENGQPNRIMSGNLQENETEDKCNERIKSFFAKRKNIIIHKIEFNLLPDGKKFVVIFFNPNEGLFVYAEEDCWLSLSDKQSVWYYRKKKYYFKNQEKYLA